MAVKTNFFKILIGLAFLALAATLLLYNLGAETWIGPVLALFFVCLALGVRGWEKLKGFSFTIWIFAAVTISMC